MQRCGLRRPIPPSPHPPFSPTPTHTNHTFEIGLHMSHTHEQVEAIFNEVCDVPPDQRRAYLSQACAGNADLLRDVESLLRELDSDVTGVIASAVSVGILDGNEPERLPERLGEFRIVRLLGEGGMGRVFEAVQESPSRSVALKVIRAGVFSRSLLSRFRREANVLAQLNHPGIAQVLQVGSITLDGNQSQPYFAMELVHGLPITEHVRSRGLDARARLALIARICDAVQHAHRRGVIHRDLKPANVLVEDATSGVGGEVTAFSRVGQPKVLDFGIARMLKEAPGTESAHSMRTEVGQIVGTLAYMSPEQASGDSCEVDTRADVYALGVLAYEVLTGRVPIEVAGKPIALAVKMIHEQVPARLGALVPSLRGDAEVIIAKALDKDPDQRYSSAGELGADIRRFLRDEPIVARPASAMYSLRKFSQRHRAALTGAVVALFGVIGSLAFGLVQIRDQRDRALKAEAETAKRADQLQKVSDFQAKMLAEVDPGVAGQRLTADVEAMFAAALIKSGATDAERVAQTAAFAAQWSNVNATDAARRLIDRTILTPAAEAIDKQFADQPIVAATLQFVVGGRYADLGLYDRSIELLTQAVQTRRRELGEDHPDTLMAYKSMGNTLSLAGRFGEAERLLHETMERSRRVLGVEHEETLYAANSLVVTYIRLGRFIDAEKLTRETLDTARRVLGEGHAQLPAIIGNLAGALDQQGKHAEAGPYFKETLEKSKRVLGEDHLITLRATVNLADFLINMGRLAEAEPFVETALNGHRRLMGNDHPDTLSALARRGYLLKARGDLAEAERVVREVLAGRLHTVGHDNPDTLASMASLASILSSRDKFEEAEVAARKAVDAHRRVYGDEHPRTLIALSNLALNLWKRGDLPDAERICDDVLKVRRRTMGAQHPETLASLNIMASILEDQKKFELAEPYYREALDTCRRMNGTEHPSIVIYLNNLGGLLWTLGKLTEAVELLREAGGIAERLHGPQHGTTLIVKLKLGGVLTDLERFDEALAALAPFEDAAKNGGVTSRSLSGTLHLRLGAARVGRREFAAAEAHLVEAHSLLNAADGTARKNLRTCVKELADLYTVWNQAEPGKHDASRIKWAAELDALDQAVTAPPLIVP